MSAYYEYMIWVDVTQTTPAMDDEPVTEFQFSLFSRLVNGQRWNHVTREDKIETITSYVRTIVGKVSPCVIIPQTGLNKKFTPDEAMTLFSKAFVGKDNMICFRIPEDIEDSVSLAENGEGDVVIPRAELDKFWDVLNRNISHYVDAKDPDVLFTFLTSLQGRLADLLG